MWYAVICEDVEDSAAARAAARPAHLARLQSLLDEGRVLIGGPHPAIDSEDPGDAGFTGSLLVIDCPSLEAAKEWVDADPYIEAGVYEKVTVKPFKLVVP